MQQARTIWRNGGSNPAFSRKSAPCRLQTNKNATFAGGNMEHLWIDLELDKSYKPEPFRFQKRVKNLNNLN